MKSKLGTLIAFGFAGTNFFMCFKRISYLLKYLFLMSQQDPVTSPWYNTYCLANPVVNIYV